MTEWRVIPSYPNYEASDAGHIRRRARGRGARAGRVLAEQVQNGYAYAHLWSCGRRRAMRVHRLVYEAWHGEIPAGHEINHEDGARLNNALHNLTAVAPSENVQHSYRVLGRAPATHGETHHKAKLDWSAVREIRQRYAQGGVTQAELGARYGVSDSVVSRVINGRAWAREG